MMTTIAFIKENINPLKPVKQCGFIQQTECVDEVHDDLMLRVMCINQDGQWVVHAVFDNIGFSIQQATQLRNEVSKFFKETTEVVISSTHTHFGGDPHDDEYFNQIRDTLLLLVQSIKMQEVTDFRVSFTTMPFNGVGTSRVSNHEANVVLDVLSFYDGDVRLATEVIYNCHPTILDGDTPYFSAEYPGVTLRDLEKEYPKERFFFLQGAAGDISTRFTRQTQSYAEVERLGLILAHKVKEVLNQVTKSEPVQIKVAHHKMPLIHELKDIDAMKVNKQASERELATIAIGRKVLEKLKENFDTLPQSVELTALHYGSVSQAFAPNELFSYYLKAIPKENCSLICYSQGYAPYVLGLEDMPLTYEAFTDTYSRATKELIFKTLREITKGD